MPEVRGMEWKSALRSLRTRPGFTALAIAILALGIGANTAIFSVVNSVLLRPLDYRDPDRIVAVGNIWKDGQSVALGSVSEPDLDDIRARSTAFEAFAGYSGGGDGASVVANNAAGFAGVTIVMEGFFRVMGVDAAQGRLLTHEEYQFGGPNVAVVSDSFVRSRLAGISSPLGAEIRAYGRPFTIIGVLPAGFFYPEKTDVWLGAIDPKNTSRTAHNWRAIGRLKPGVTAAQAQGELDSISAQLAAEYPISNRRKTFHALPVRDVMVANVRTTLWILLGSVALVLLIACANVANLLLALATSRQREIALRAALGASRGRIAFQLLIESAAIAVIAGAAGLALAGFGVDALVRLAPANLPRLAEVHVDGWVLAFTLALSLAASIVFGLAPALQATRIDLNDTLKQGGRGSAGAAGGGLRGTLVVAEIAISMVLLVGAGLLIRSFDRLTSTELGYRTDHLLVVETNLPADTKADARRSNALYGEVARQIAGIPGVAGASAALGLAGGTPRSNGGYVLEGGPGFDQLGTTVPQADFFVIMPDYFRTLSVPLRAGRDFDSRDRFDGPYSVIVNEALVRRSFPGENPIGRRIRCGMDSPEFMTIIGVAADFRGSDPGQPPRPAMFMPYLQHPFFATRMTFVARTAGDPLSFAESVRKTVRQVSADFPVRFSTMEERLSTTVASPRFRSVLLGVFAGLAVLLAMSGVYGVMAYAVAQRSAEIGVRMALGADGATIMSMILRSGAKLAAIGLVAGFAIAWPAVRLLESMLYEVAPADLTTWLITGAVIALTTLAACLIPALRASRLDPLAALRQD